MRDSWIPKEEELAVVAATVPLLASLTIVKRSDGQVSAWSHPDAIPLDALTLARLLPAAGGAMGAGGGTDLSLTLASSTQSVVVTELGLAWIVVFGFREAVSYDWTSYYVRRALGLFKRRDP